MKRALISVVSLLVTLLAAQVSQACTATSTFAQAQRMHDSEEYKVVRSAVIDEIADEEEWVFNESIDAAIGTIAFEGMQSNRRRRQSGQAVDLTDYNEVVKLLDRQARIRHKHPKTGNVVDRVRDHAIFHGEEWEAGVDQWGRPVRGWNVTLREPREVANVDHAG